ncbi:MAG: GerMN domain-containing protein [Suipraeoptans sp.]
MKKLKVGFIIALFVVLVSACGHDNKPQAEDDFIYYLNTDGDGLTIQKYEIKNESNMVDTISNVVKDLMKSPESIDYNSVFPEGLSVNDISISAENATLDFNRKYNNMNITQETMLKAAVVQTIDQVEGISSVSFTVGNNPIKDSSGDEVGEMRASDFVQNVGSSIHTTEKADIVLYYTDSTGKMLVEENTSVRYNSNTTTEKLVVEQLMKGPDGNTQNAIIPSEATLLSVTVKDDICYVNFSEGFLTGTLDVSADVTIYSIVNSIIANSDVDKVQILVAGETNVSYQGILDLSKPFSSNKDIIK